MKIKRIFLENYELCNNHEADLIIIPPKDEDGNHAPELFYKRKDPHWLIKELNDEQKLDFKKYQNGIEFLNKALQELASAKNIEQVKTALGNIGKASKKGHKNFKMDCDKK